MRNTELVGLGCVIGFAMAYMIVAFLAWDWVWIQSFASQDAGKRFISGVMYLILNAFTCLACVFVVTVIADDYKTAR